MNAKQILLYKSPTNLTETDLAALREAGIIAIQVESFDDVKVIDPYTADTRNDVWLSGTAARHCGNCADGVPGGPDNCSKCGREQQYSHWAPRFEKTYCSQCGGTFGPGEQGYSHCEDHPPQGGKA